MNDNLWIKVSREPHSVYIFLHRSLLAQIEYMITPYFDIVQCQKPILSAWKILIVEPENYVEESWDIINPKIPGEDFLSRTYRYLPEFKTIYIQRPESINLKTQIAVRLCRDILKHLHHEKNMMFFHGGMIVYKGKGICFMGGKKSGKTSSILAFLSTGSAEYVTNDDVSISFYSCRKSCGYGWPRAISVRCDSLEFMKNLLDGFNLKDRISTGNLSHPNNEFKELSDYLYLYPNDLANIFKCKIATEHQIDAVIFPRFSKNGKFFVREIFGEEKRRSIIENMDTNFSRYFIDFKHCFSINDELFLDQDQLDRIRCFALSQNIFDMKSIVRWADNEYV